MSTTHATGTREQWIAARRALLEAEKEHTRRGDELARQRQALPWVRVEKDYRFQTEQGEVTLVDLFRGNSQLLIYHLMFGPEYSGACPVCSTIADGFNGSVVHLANHDVTLMAVSRAPLAALQSYKQRMGWTFEWASSEGSDFNFDYAVSFTEEEQRVGGAEYNFSARPPLPPSEPDPEGFVDQIAAMTGTDVPTYTREAPGVSAFLLEDGAVYHTYSSYARGVDAIWGMYAWLDRAPKGRNETGPWFRRKDEYTNSRS